MQDECIADEYVASVETCESTNKVDISDSQNKAFATLQLKGKDEKFQLDTGAIPNITACTARTQRREHLLAHSEEHTARNSKKYTGMYSSHTAKGTFTRTQRGAHSSQFEKIYRHVQFAQSEGKIYSHTARSTQLTI